jgi:hypothetical protein
VELRRALLLFAIVLGLAAIASSIARPPERESADVTDPPTTDSRTPAMRGDATTPSATPIPGTPSAGATTIRFRTGGRRQLRRLEQGRPATVLVAIDTSGQVEIPSLGLTQPAEPLTPAHFDILVTAPGVHEIVLHPASAGAPSATVGTLRIVPRR